MSKGVNAISLHPDDNVATVLAPIDQGQSITVQDQNGKHTTFIATTAVPRYFKVAIRDIANSQKIVKSGQPIGAATSSIRVGDQVHVHNIRSNRAVATDNDN